MKFVLLALVFTFPSVNHSEASFLKYTKKFCSENLSSDTFAYPTSVANLLPLYTYLNQYVATHAEKLSPEVRTEYMNYVVAVKNNKNTKEEHVLKLMISLHRLANPDAAIDSLVVPKVFIAPHLDRLKKKIPKSNDELWKTINMLDDSGEITYGAWVELNLKAIESFTPDTPWPRYGRKINKPPLKL